MSARKGATALRNKHKLSASIIVVFILLFQLNCERNTGQIDIALIENYDRAHKYKEIVNQFVGFKWSEINNPYLLPLYCNALVKTGRELPQSLKNQATPVHIRELAFFYYNLFMSKFSVAKAHLDKIPRGPKNAQTWAWHSIGSISYSLGTGSIYHMDQPLLNLKDAATNYPDIVPRETLLYYDALHKYHSGNFSGIKRIIEQNSTEIDSYDLSELKVLVFLSENDVDSATLIAKDMLKRYPYDAAWLSIDAALISIINTPEESLRIYQDKWSQGKDFWLYKKHYAYALTEMEQHDKAIDILRELSEHHPYEYDIQLDIAHLSYYQNRDLTYANEVLGNSEYFQLPYFLYIMADLSKSSGKLEKAKEYFKYAKFLNPNAQYNLWYEYRQAKDEGNVEGATQVLDRIKYLYPYNSNIPSERKALQSLSK